MKKLQLFLAVLACSLASSVSAQRIEGDQLKIVEGISGVDPETNFIYIRGEVMNNTGKWIKSTSVEIDMLDANGKSITVTGFLAEHRRELGRGPLDSVVAERNYLPPGEVAVFERPRDSAKLSAPYASHKLYAKAWAVEGTPPKMAIENLKTSVNESGYFIVSGTIHNVGTVACRTPKAVLGFYAEDGKLLHADSEEPDEMFQKHLAPGKSVDFHRQNITQAKGAKDVKAWGDCADPE